MSFIVANGLGKRFDDFWAVEDFTLTVDQGEVVAVLGPNGVGKTTTVRMLVSVLAPTRGSATVAGYDVQRQSTEVRRHVGVLTEQHGLYTRMTARAYLDFFGEVYGLDASQRQKQSEKWLTYFGLTEAANKRIGTFSKGMRQKLALARALLHEPPVILLDEPTSAMDPVSANLVRQAIKSLRSEKRAILLCTHNLVEAEALADRIAIMSKGRLVAVGSPAELKARWLGALVFEATLAAPIDNDAFRQWAKRALPPAVEVVAVEQNRLRFRSPQWERDNPQVLKALVENGYRVIKVTEVDATLEQVYFEVMKHETG